MPFNFLEQGLCFGTSKRKYHWDGGSNIEKFADNVHSHHKEPTFKCQKLFKIWPENC